MSMLYTIEQLVVISFKVYRLSHLGHAINFSSIVGHIKFEADFMVSKTEEKRYNDVKQIFDST